MECRVIEVARDVVQPRLEAVPDRVFERFAFGLRHCLAHLAAEVRVGSGVSCHPDDGKRPGEQSFFGEVIDGGKELAAREVS